MRREILCLWLPDTCYQRPRFVRGGLYGPTGSVTLSSCLTTHAKGAVLAEGIFADATMPFAFHPMRMAATSTRSAGSTRSAVQPQPRWRRVRCAFPRASRRGRDTASQGGVSAHAAARRDRDGAPDRGRHLRFLLVIAWLPKGRRRWLRSGSHRLRAGGRYWDRTSDLFGVNEARSRCANRPLPQ